jgi:hypothetical protein
MLRCRHGVRSKQSHGSSTLPEARATAEHPFAAERLKRAVGFGNESRCKKQQTFRLVHVIYRLVKSDYDPL